MLRVQLAQHLECSVVELDEARENAAADWPAYVRGLFADAGITGMLLDPGAERFLTADGAQACASLADVPMWELLRVDPLVDRLIFEGAGGHEIAQTVEDALNSAATDGAVGAKTVLAYRTGLAVQTDIDMTGAERSLRSELPARPRGKKLRHFLLRRVPARCCDLKLPLQEHTGFGDSDLRLAEADPLLLDEILRTPEGQRANVVLLHGGFPWHEQAAYLAPTHQGVWVDFSLSNLMSPATTADRLLRLIDLVPTTRLLMDSDGHELPETHWFAVGTLRAAWKVVRERLGHLARAEWLDNTENALFDENARELYQL
ncbi:MAG: amidohydrolase family protein [Geodermatophilaceae bacterium]